MTPKLKTIIQVLTYVVLNEEFFVTEGTDYDVACFNSMKKECVDVFYKNICQDDGAPVTMSGCCSDIMEIDRNCYYYALVKQASDLHLCDDRPISARGESIFWACYGYS
ncbi:hypothetical protein AAHA92_19493 [Salvia divinorum]|uniref:Prolamin-like domain-containing protein n=1 Tax=Salvia divinorum TaxID=28513 RepID=A0ABD1H5I8_SALDI